MTVTLSIPCPRQSKRNEAQPCLVNQASVVELLTAITLVASSPDARSAFPLSTDIVSLVRHVR